VLPLVNSLAITHSRDDHSDILGGDGRLLPSLGAFSRGVMSSSSASSPCKSCHSRWLSCRCSFFLPQRPTSWRNNNSRGHAPQRQAVRDPGCRTRCSRSHWRSFCCTNFIAQLPESLIEAARVDGASHLRIFRTIVLPLSMAGYRVVRDIPVPLGLERSARRQDLWWYRSRKHSRLPLDW